MWPTGTFRNPWGDGSAEKRQKDSHAPREAEKTEETLEEIFRKVPWALNKVLRSTRRLVFAVPPFKRRPHLCMEQMRYPSRFLKRQFEDSGPE